MTDQITPPTTDPPADLLLADLEQPAALQGEQVVAPPASSDTAPRRRHWSAWPIVGLTILFYYWTGTSGRTSSGPQRDYYNQLTTAFLRGHLSLTERPPKGITIDEIERNIFLHARYLDLALYHRHFFLTWGPTPVITLLMPWRLLHVGSMPVNIGVFLYCAVGLVFAAALLCFLVDRFLPQAKEWQLALGVCALGASNIAPFLLRRPAVYELAESSGYCFAMIAAYLIATGALGSRVGKWRLALGSLSVGLAMGGRPEYALEALLLVGALAWILHGRRTEIRRELPRLGAVLFGPLAVAVVLLFAYNAVRFGSVFDYGIKYCLCGEQVSKLPTLSTSYVAPGMWAYLVSPVRWTLAFPYATLPPPPAYPGHLPQYYLQELCAGIITTTPIVLIVIPAVPFLWRRNRALATVVISLALVGALSMLLSSAYFFQYTMRYETAFASFFVLAAVLSWLAMTRGRFRRLLGAVGSVALIYGCVVGVAISFYGYYDLLRVNDSGTYWAMARLTSPLPTLATMVEGHPDIVRVIATTQCAAAPSLGSEYCATSGNSGTFNINGNRYPFASAPTEVDIVSPSSGKWTLTSRFSRTFFLPKDARVTFLIRNGTHQTVVPLRQAAVHGIPLTLHMGLNRILIDANSPYIPPLIPVLTGQGVSLRGR